MSKLEEQTEDCNPWKDAMENAAITNWCLTDENADDPEKMLQAIIATCEMMALDPAISLDAQKLIAQGRAQGFEAARSMAADLVEGENVSGPGLECDAYVIERDLSMAEKIRAMTDGTK